MLGKNYSWWTISWRNSTFFEQGWEKYAEASKELLNMYEQGKLKIPYHIEEGIENFPLALQKLFAGGNTGKLMVKA